MLDTKYDFKKVEENKYNNWKVLGKSLATNLVVAEIFVIGRFI